MAAWVGPAITAVGGVISSLFGGKKKTDNRVNYQQMVADAEAAGFNPLTVLRNGGSAGYMQTAHPGLSSGEVIGQALGNVGNFLADFDPYADDKRELASRLAEAQIANLNASTATMFPPAPGKPGSFNVPSWAAANTEQRPSGRAGRLSASGPITSAVLDGYTYRGSGEGGAIEDMWVVYRQPDGTYVRAPNPNLPDGEQLVVPPLVAAENVTTRPISSRIMDDGGWITSRPLTEKEKKARDESWWPSWLPSVSYEPRKAK